MIEPVGQRARRRAEADPVEAFYRDRFVDAVRLAHLLSGDASIAEDLAQNSFDKLRTRFDEVDAPWAYLRTIILNECRSLHRTRARELARARRMSEPTEHALGARELLDAVDRLPYRQKSVIVLRYYEDLSEAEIALLLGCRPGTVKSLASRALRQLAQEVPRW